MLWGARKGQPDWTEEIITESDNPATVKAAREWAEQNGFDRLRETVIDGSLSDFVGALNIGRRKKR